MQKFMIHLYSNKTAIEIANRANELDANDMATVLSLLWVSVTLVLVVSLLVVFTM